MDQPWQIYYEELHERAGEVPDHELGRVEDMTEAAHEAYEATADRLVNRLGHDEKDALALTRSFGAAVKEWIEEDSWDWSELQEKLETRELVWEGGASLG